MNTITLNCIRKNSRAMSIWPKQMILMILAGSKKWLVKGFDFDVAKAEQIFDLLLKEKQLKLPENHKMPTTQELQGMLYCK